MSSRIWMVFSGCPSVWGWKAVLNFSCVPNPSCRETTYKTGILVWDYLFRHSMQPDYLFYIELSVYPTLSSIKCADFVNLSTITQTTSLPAGVLGKAETKSMVTHSHFHSGGSRGCNSPPGRWCSTLTCWHFKHFDTYSATSLFKPVHQKCCFKSWYIFVLPGWTEYAEEWASLRISFLKPSSSGTHNLFPYRIIPSSSTFKSVLSLN